MLTPAFRFSIYPSAVWLTGKKKAGTTHNRINPVFVHGNTAVNRSHSRLKEEQAPYKKIKRQRAAGLKWAQLYY